MTLEEVAESYAEADESGKTRTGRTPISAIPAYDDCELGDDAMDEYLDRGRRF